MKMTMENGRAGDLESSATATANAISLVSPSLLFNNCLLPRVLFAILHMNSCFSIYVGFKSLNAVYGHVT
jgi:hypothetical protein